MLVKRSTHIYEISQVFFAVWSIFFVFLIVLCLHYVSSRILVLSVAFFLCAITLLLLWRYRDLIDQQNRLTMACAAVIMIVFFLCILRIGRAMLIFPTSDSGTIWYSVADIVDTGSISTEVNNYTSCYWFTHTSNHNYFLIYPNTRFMVAYLLPYCRMVHEWFGIDLRSSAGYFCGEIFNAVSIELSVLFAFLAARKEKGNTSSLLTLVGCFFFLPFYLNVYRVYSDTMSMPYVSLPVWFIILADHEKQTVRRAVLRFASGLSLATGILIKGSLWILVVAVIIYFIVKNKWSKKTLLDLLPVVLGVLVITQAWAEKADHLSWLDTTEADQYQLPTMHWIWMASSGNGGFDQEKTELVLSLDSVDERSAYAKQAYLHQLQEYGAWGFLKFTLYKIGITFSDGAFTQQNYLDRHEGGRLGKFVTSSGRYFAVFRFYVSMYLFYCYLAIAASALISIFKRDVSVCFLFHLCMFGIVLFFCFWEIKSRYLLNYSPLLILCTVFAYDDIITWMKAWRRAPTTTNQTG